MPTQRTQRADGIGAPLPRVEDARLLTGQGHYAGDFFPDNLCHATLVRSPHAHARIRSIDGSAAKAMPGVLTVLTGEDAATDGMGPIPHNPDWVGPPDAELRLPEGFNVYLTENLPMPINTVRYVGEAVALVVAETAALAAEAAELVKVEFDPLPTFNSDSLLQLMTAEPDIFRMVDGYSVQIRKPLEGHQVRLKFAEKLLAKLVIA